MITYKIMLDRGFTHTQAKTTWDIITGNFDVDVLENVRKWVRQCYNRPMKYALQLCGIDEIIEGHGVEFCEDSNCSYINMGDTYSDTVYYSHDEDEFFIGDLEQIIYHKSEEDE